MIRLNLKTEPFWFDARHGVKLKLAPLTSAVMMAARSDPSVRALGEDGSRDQRALAVCKAIGRLRRGRVAFVAEVRSLAHYLNQTVGRTFQFHCDAELGDARCGVDLEASAFSAAGTVASVSGDRGFVASAGLEVFPSGWFDLGLIEWTSGANAGRRAEIARHADEGSTVRIDLFEAPVRPLSPGDGFTIRAGCDKRFAICRTKFANAVNFRGFPAMPGDDVVLRYPNQGDVNSGRPLVRVESGE